MTEVLRVVVRIPKDSLEAQDEFNHALRFLKDGKEGKKHGDQVEFIFFDSHYYRAFVACLLYDLRLFPEVEITDGNGTRLHYEEKKSEAEAVHISHGPRQFPASPRN